jgi:predicted AAA+ superfamily ATPase
MSTLKPWRQVATPHADIRQGRFDASVFAADLGEVLANRGAVDYRDPATFFGKTFLTRTLSDLLKEVMGRLAGSGKAEPVIQLQTPFGGGKTHTLFALYHLLKSPREVGRLPAIKGLLDAAGLKAIPAAGVACLVGTALNVHSDRTLWGEMAHQLGGDRLYRKVAKDDGRKTAPGTKVLGELLQEAGPSLILIDEPLEYLVKAGGVPVADSTLRANTLAFLQELGIAVANCPHAILVTTLTSHTSEQLGEAGENLLGSLEKVLGRVEKIRLPVEGAEIYEVIRRRLFESLGDAAQHRAAAEAYWAMYQKLGEDVPGACREPAYRDTLVAAYPFHPELIAVLYERWGTIPQFQRTRGVLRLLAFLVSDLYQGKDNEPVIQSGSVHLGSAELRGELVKLIGNNAFHAVVDSDIAGKQAKAPEIDRQLGSEYAKESVSEKLARATFLYSFGGGHQKGATLPQLRLAVLNPEMAPPFVSDALNRMTKRLWYLYAESGLYSFEARPNLNRILVDREELVRSEQDKVKDFVRATLNDMIGEAAFRVYRYPESDRDVADEPRPSLVVLDLNQPASEDGVPPATEEFVSRILKQHGKGFRKHSNVLIFLAPDQKKVSDVVDAAVRLLARRHIDQDKATKRQLSDKQLTDLANRLKEAEAQLPAAIAQAYRHVLVPAEKKALRPFDLGIAAYDARAKLSNRVLDLLKGHDQLLDKLDPDHLTGTRWGLWPHDQPLVNVKAMADYFTQLTHLPMLTGPTALSDCIARGVERGLFAYALGDGEARKFDTLYFRQNVDAAKCDIADSAWLLRPELAKTLLPEKPVLVGPGGGAGGTTTTGEDEEGGTSTGDGGGAGLTAGGVKIVQGERRLDRVRITMRISWEEWNDIYNEVIDPLAQEGADILCDVNIVARGDAAIRENTVELVIREALTQRGIRAQIEKG